MTIPALIAAILATGHGLKVMATDYYGPVLGTMPLAPNAKLPAALDALLTAEREAVMEYVMATVVPCERGGTTCWELLPVRNSAVTHSKAILGDLEGSVSVSAASKLAGTQGAL